ncbi:hypothetical protein ERX27_01935 [Macrococcus brunensis]|uniref:Uncharacterized protein n=1 Tax=Macrococcus brunensis TaxID=198483 RepID=A0A4R6BFC7_9STAP|nr:DnaD domain protein [Macrococcus brunensis]TDL98557.1 hypothetical protein ERX27_01935 [Macrococcus brunensis]ULG71294.1 DnaD domain protein [Macrococcus brunensis]ULG73600.1 DnaD domain protein [Macrococcus brunensis]
MQYFSGLRPADRFVVTTNYVETSLTDEILKRLYIPLIGLESIAVYQYLSQFLEKSQVSDEVTHYIVMNELKMNLSHFEQLRFRLEGIGLMKSFMKVTDEAQHFVYKLISPVMPDQFFNDPMLSVYLFQTVGKERFNQLKRHFCTERFDVSSYQEISKNYIDIYGTPKSPPASIYAGNDHLIKTRESLGIPVHQQTFDFEMLEMLLAQNMITKEQLTRDVRELIAQLSLLYDIAPTDMRRIILKSLTSNQTISHEDLRRNARDFYQFEHEGNLPALTISAEAEAAPKSDKNWFEMLDTTSPIEMLASFSQSEPTVKQKRMVESILEREKLPFGVMNILLQYVLLTSEMKLPQSYIEEIASNWKKLKLSSSEEAYNHAMKVEEKKKTRKTVQREKASYEKTPEWLNNQEQPKTAEAVTDLAEEKRKLEEELKNFWKEGES